MFQMGRRSMESLRSGTVVSNVKRGTGTLISRSARRLNSGRKSIVREVLLRKSATYSTVSPSPVQSIASKNQATHGRYMLPRATRHKSSLANSQIASNQTKRRVLFLASGSAAPLYVTTITFSVIFSDVGPIPTF